MSNYLLGSEAMERDLMIYEEEWERNEKVEYEW